MVVSETGCDALDHLFKHNGNIGSAVQLQEGRRTGC